MKKNFFIFFISCFTISFSQKRITPKIETENKYSISEYKFWSKTIKLNNELNKLNARIKYDELTLAQKKAIDSIEQGYGPITQGVGCSWYCGGGPYKTTASSVLDKKESYSEQNIHDFNLLTAWVPESKNGLNETINFHFKPKSPRVNEIVIYNGYIKSEKLWRENSRAKEIILLINNKAIGVLHLKDTSAAQKFKIPLSHTRKESSDIIITLKIKDFYPGDKYNDLVISEINFDGIDVH